MHLSTLAQCLCLCYCFCVWLCVLWFFSPVVITLPSTCICTLFIALPKGGLRGVGSRMPASDFRRSSHHGGKGGFQKLDESGAPVEPEKNVSEWTSEDVGKWLNGLGLGEHAKAFEHHRIVGDMVHSLTESHLTELGVTLIGQRMTFLRDASRIRRHTVNKVRFETIWESDAVIYTRGPADWLYRQCIFEPCAPPTPLCAN